MVSNFGFFIFSTDLSCERSHGSSDMGHHGDDSLSSSILLKNFNEFPALKRLLCQAGLYKFNNFGLFQNYPALFVRLIEFISSCSSGRVGL
jgi:hypothetical protein